MNEDLKNLLTALGCGFLILLVAALFVLVLLALAAM